MVHRMLKRGTCVFVLCGILACDGDLPTNPYVTSGGGGTGGEGGSGGTGVDPELGGPCVEDAQCDDEIACTTDSCDKSIDRCRFRPEDAGCDNGVHCDGAEVCAQKLGCVAGPPASCDDGNFCTIDTCVETSQACTHELRDADGDTDVDIHCGGGDCNETDPEISSLVEEVCANDVDDNCDRMVDEAACSTPMNDTCADPVLVDSSGNYSLLTFGASAQYPTSCTPAGPVNDVVMAVVVPPGPPQDVVIRARAQAAELSTALAEQCGNAASELACGASYSSPAGGNVSKLRARSLPADATYPVYVTTSQGDQVAVNVSIEPGSIKPGNETCGTAQPLVSGAPFVVDLIDAAEDQNSACGTATGELVYALELTEPADLEIYAVSTDGDGFPSISLLADPCSDMDAELACHTAAQANLYRHELPAGTYYLAVSATAPTEVSVNVSLLPPTPTPSEDACLSAPALEPLTPVDIDYATLQDDHLLPCLQASVDAAYSLSIDAPTDLLLVNRLSPGDSAALALSAVGCNEADVLSCAVSGNNPLRLRRRNLAAGEYRVISESLVGLPQQLTAFERPYSATKIVPFSDACADAISIPSGGGFFQGNTSNLSADFSAGCDADGQPPNGAKDQLLKLVLTETRRVVLDMSGSGYATMLSVRKGPNCPGVELPLACTAAVSSVPSFLDLELEAGSYFVQVDGLAGATGPWSLDVFVVAP